MRVVLISNYLPDRQESMLRLAELFRGRLSARGFDVAVARPAVFFGRLAGILPRFGKWLGYLDKYVIFPLALWWRARRRPVAGSEPVVFHICDHSNAMYSFFLAGAPNLVTCADVLAIRSALGEIKENPTGVTGRILQRWILAGLRNAKRIVCISQNSARELRQLLDADAEKISAALLPLNYPYSPMPREEADGRVAKLLPKGVCETFVLHVGVEAWYKNRLGVAEIYRAVAERRTGRSQTTPALVFVGSPVTGRLLEFFDAHPNLPMHSLMNLENEDLRALYSRAAVMLFPSLQEGYGWPIAEGLACGCPVVTTGRAPMTEVGGDAATYIDPGDIEEASRVVDEILSESVKSRSERVAAGIEHAATLSAEVFIDRYVAAYSEVFGGARVVVE